MFTPRASRKHIFTSPPMKRRKGRKSSILITEEELEEIGRVSFQNVHVARQPPSGFPDWQRYYMALLKGLTEYKYSDVHIGDNPMTGRQQLQKGGFPSVGGSNYGYNGYPLHVRVPQGYDRNESIGHRLDFRSLDLTVTVQQTYGPYPYENTDKFAIIRLILVMDTKAADPGYLNINFANLRDDAPGDPTDKLFADGRSLYSHYNLDNQDRYIILYDKLHELPIGKHKSFNYYRTNESEAGKTEFAMRTIREANSNMWQFACEEGGNTGDQRNLNALLNIHLNQEGNLTGSLPPDAVYVGTIDDQLLTNSYLKFGKVFVQPGISGGDVVQEQLEGVISINPIRNLWRYDTSEWVQKIHIDFEDDLYTLLTAYQDEDTGKIWNWFNDYGIYLAVQTVSQADATMGLWVESRLTFWNHQ